MIGSLLYLTASRPDIMFNVCLCARFEKETREVHLTVVKCIFRYLIGTHNLGLMFKRSESFRLTSYCDVDYAKDKVERKSTSESCHFIGGNLVTCDAILPRKGLVTRAMSKRLQEDWARTAEEGPRVLMNLRVDF